MSKWSIIQFLLIFVTAIVVIQAFTDNSDARRVLAMTGCTAIIGTSVLLSHIHREAGKCRQKHEKRSIAD